jgi:virginiamycin A acetyltransferase
MIICKEFLKLLLKILSNATKVHRKLRWRQLNTHNYTTYAGNFPLNCVEIGNNSYGPINAFFYGQQNEKLVIGNYCSIAGNVKFLLGGEHRTDRPSSYPIEHFNSRGTKNSSFTKGPIVVSDHVWIGFGSLILSGVTIGKGAVIAAGAVVVKDVEEYTIVGGNPAKVIRKLPRPTNVELLAYLND